MKKLLLFLFVSVFGTTGYAQTAAEKKAAKTDLDNVKRFYDRLKASKIDTKTELLWEYTYLDTTEIQLKKLAEAFEKGGLKIAEIVPSPKNPKLYMLKVSEVKKYPKPETVNERMKHLNEVAQVYKIESPYAILGAERQEKEGEIGTYKKVGKQK